MTEKNQQVSQMLRCIYRLRRVWIGFSPCDTLNKSQLRTLLAIRNYARLVPEKAGETPTLSDLAEIMRQSLPAISQRVRTLETMGFIARVPHPGDRRVSGVCLTEEGEKVMQQAYRRLSGMLCQSMDSLGTEDSAQLIGLLDRLAAAIEQTAAEDRKEQEKKP